MAYYKLKPGDRVSNYGRLKGWVFTNSAGKSPEQLDIEAAEHRLQFARMKANGTHSGQSVTFGSVEYSGNHGRPEFVQRDVRGRRVN